jgi:carboxypeptidase C (cathepsin A)
VDELSVILESGVKVLIWTGDLDYTCNTLGTNRVAEAVEWSGQQAFLAQEMMPYMMQGVQKGSFKVVDNLNLVNLIEAGHNIMWYRKCLHQSLFRHDKSSLTTLIEPELGLQIFQQLLLDEEGLHST